MKCGHCGATNSDSAKFCSKCAFRLPSTASNVVAEADPKATIAQAVSGAAVKGVRPHAGNGPTETPLFDDDDTTIIIAPKAPATAATLPQRRQVPVQPTAPIAATTSAAMQLSPAHSKTPLLMIGIALMLLIVVALWWARRNAAPPVEPPVPAVPTISAAPSAPLPSAAPVPDSAMTTELPVPVVAEVAIAADVPTPAAISPQQKAVLLARAEKQKVRREADQKRKAEQEMRRKQDDDVRTQAAEATRLRDADARNRQEEQTRLAKISAAHRSPQQACADRPNFISRGLCESRECEKPEQARLAFCVQMHERRAPRETYN